jgi:polyisoprenoid-binding protein YceI
MTHFDASSAECLVFTYKEGLLSTVAHDLKIRVTRFTIDADEATRTIEAWFDARSLRVVCAMRDGVEARGELTAANKREIEGNIVRDVLDAATYPDIRFTGSAVEEGGERYVITGRLALHGRQRQIRAHVRRAGDRFIAEARVHQPAFGVRPYSALLGTLKVQPDVTVQISVPATAPG